MHHISSSKYGLPQSNKRPVLLLGIVLVIDCNNVDSQRNETLNAIYP